MFWSSLHALAGASAVLCCSIMSTQLTEVGKRLAAAVEIDVRDGDDAEPVAKRRRLFISRRFLQPLPVCEQKVLASTSATSAHLALSGQDTCVSISFDIMGKAHLGGALSVITLAGPHRSLRSIQKPSMA